MFENISRPWLDHYDEEVRPHIDYKHLPVFGYLMRSAKKNTQTGWQWSFKIKKISYKKNLIT